MTTLSARRCFVHTEREAVCLCTSCGRPHCRECVSEYEGRMMCAACAHVSEGPQKTQRNIPAAVTAPLSIAIALVVAWAVFYSASKLLPSGMGGFSDVKIGDAR